MRVVLDVNVLISALLSPSGPPAALVLAWLRGAFELVVSDALLAELTRALAYPKIRARVPAEDAERFVRLLRRHAEVLPDSATLSPIRPGDPGDDYLVALAASAQALLITGDGRLLELADRAPIHTPAELVDLIDLD